MKARRLLKIIVICWLAIVVSGCAGPKSIPISYVPAGGMKGPLSTLAPMTVALRAKNKGGDQFPFGIIYRVSGEELEAALFDAIKNGLELNGHTVVRPGWGEARALMEVSIDEVVVLPEWGHWIYSLIAAVSVWDVRNPSIPKANSVIVGSVRQERHLQLWQKTAQAFPKAINDMLTELARNLAYDTSILEALQAVQRP